MVNEMLVKQLKRDYTGMRPCVVEDMPDAHTVWMIVGVQQFCVTPQAIETAEDADWTRDMLAHALAVVIEDHKARFRGGVHSCEIPGCAVCDPTCGL